MYEYRYKYDKVGNRTAQTLVARSGAPTLERWAYMYNGLNQLTQRTRHSDMLLPSFTEKWLYTYDGNGNLTVAEKQNGSNVKQEKWVYSWNPRDQMTKAEKFTGTGDTYAGKAEYLYCLSCDGALSERKEFDSGSTTVPISWKRFEYDGLNLLRVDERYDDETSPPDGIDSGDPWRTLEVATHKPGALGAMLGKRVYTHTNNDATPDSTTDYGYVYDAVGNVMSVFLDDDDEGAEAFYFVQDAFGNEIDVAPFSGDDWDVAADDGVTEHQTGKWVDEFTGLYFFHARWYQGDVGRFVGRDPISKNRNRGNCNTKISFNGLKPGETNHLDAEYTYARNSPSLFVDSGGTSSAAGVMNNIKDRIKGPPGQICMGPECNKCMPCFKRLGENGGALEGNHKSGTCYNVDAVYSESGILKIPNRCTCYANCSSGGGFLRPTITIICFCDNFWPIGTLADPCFFPCSAGSCLRPPGWPKNSCAPSSWQSANGDENAENNCP